MIHLQGFIRLLIPLGLISLLVGCLSPHPPFDTINSQIDVFGLHLFSRSDLHTIHGVKAEIEPCLRGAEYRFEPLDLSLGVTAKGALRLITTRNRESRLFGIRVGDNVASAQEKLILAGFTQRESPYRFVQGWAQINLLVDDGGTIFGLSIEVLE